MEIGKLAILYESIAEFPSLAALKPKNTGAQDRNNEWLLTVLKESCIRIEYNALPVGRCRL